MSDKIRADVRLWPSPAGILTECPLAPTSSVVKPPVLEAYLHKPAPPVTWIQRHHRPEVCVSVATPRGCYETLQPKDVARENKLSSKYFRVEVVFYSTSYALSPDRTSTTIITAAMNSKDPSPGAHSRGGNAFTCRDLLYQSDLYSEAIMYCKTETKVH